MKPVKKQMQQMWVQWTLRQIFPAMALSGLLLAGWAFMVTHEKLDLVIGR